jgi:hypothetical protein
MAVQQMQGMTVDEIDRALEDGSRVRVYEYVLAFILVTFTKRSPAYVLRQGEQLNWKLGLRYNLISFLLGWWFVPPFGFINTVDAIKSNFEGGLDITDEVASEIKIFKMTQSNPGN